MYPLLRIDDQFDQLRGFLVYLRIDLQSGYYRLEIELEVVPRMAPRARYGHYKLIIMSFEFIDALPDLRT